MQVAQHALVGCLALVEYLALAEEEVQALDLAAVVARLEVVDCLRMEAVHQTFVLIPAAAAEVVGRQERQGSLRLMMLSPVMVV